MGEVQFAKQFLTTLDSKTTKYQADHVFDPKDFQTRIPYTLPRLSHPPHPLPPTANAPSTPPPGSTAAIPSITIILRSTRNPAMTLTLPTLDPTTTTIQSLKESVQSTLGGPSVVSLEKIKILLSKKPIPASKKTVSEALEGTADTKGKDNEAEFGIMVMGGAPDPPAQADALPPQTQPSGPGSENAAAEAAAIAANPALAATMDATASMEGVEEAGAEPAATQQPPGDATGEDALNTDDFWRDLEGFVGQRIKDATVASRVRDLFMDAWKKSR